MWPDEGGIGRPGRKGDIEYLYIIVSDLKYKNHLLCSILDGPVGMRCQEGHDVDPATGACEHGHAPGPAAAAAPTPPPPDMSLPCNVEGC